MRPSDVNQDTTSDSQPDANSNFQTPNGQDTASQSILKTSHPQVPERKRDPFEKFIERFPVSFYYFAQNPNTASLIDEADKDAVVSALNNLQNRQFVTYFSTMAFNIAIMNVINRRNKIFALTRRISFWGILFKYMIIPNFVTDAFGRLIYIPAYNGTTEPIKNRYTFQDPIFKTEYEKDPHPEETIKMFYEGKLNKKSKTGEN